MAASIADEITLRMPRDRAFHGVAQLVLGGLASRRISFEGLEDLRIALDSLLDRRDVGEEVVIVLRLADSQIEASIGPFRPGVREELELDSDSDVGLRRILDAVADRVELAEQPDGYWIRLTKRTAPAPGSLAR